MTSHQFLVRNRIPIVVTAICVLLFLVYIIGAPQTFLDKGIYAALMGTIAFSGILAVAATFIVTLGEIDLSFPSVRETSLADIWTRSEAFARFRGVDWMPEPCRGYDRREIDWGGCRCQALALTGRADAVDPACEKSPDHGLMREAVLAAEDGAAWVPRQ